MAAQNGKDLLIKLDMTDTGSFETIAGLRATRISFNAATVEVTSLESGGWRELLAGAGMKQAALSGSGVFKDAATTSVSAGSSSRAARPCFRSSSPISALSKGRSRSPRSNTRGRMTARQPTSCRWLRPGG